LNASGYISPVVAPPSRTDYRARYRRVFDEGTRVAAGQLLATLTTSDVKRSLDSAKADRDASQAAIADYEVQLKNAQILLHRAEQLQKKLASRRRKPSTNGASTAADSLKAKIELAKQQVAASEHASASRNRPWTIAHSRTVCGALSSQGRAGGEMVSPNPRVAVYAHGIATIVDMKSNEIEVDVSASFTLRASKRPTGYSDIWMPIPTSRFPLKCGRSSPPPTAEGHRQGAYHHPESGKIDSFCRTWA